MIKLTLIREILRQTTGLSPFLNKFLLIFPLKGLIMSNQAKNGANIAI